MSRLYYTYTQCSFWKNKRKKGYSMTCLENNERHLKLSFNSTVKSPLFPDHRLNNK